MFCLTGSYFALFFLFFIHVFSLNFIWPLSTLKLTIVDKHPIHVVTLEWFQGASTYTSIHTNTHSHTNTYIHTHGHTHTNTQTDTHTQSDTHIFVHHNTIWSWVFFQNLRYCYILFFSNMYWIYQLFNCYFECCKIWHSITLFSLGEAKLIFVLCYLRASF